MKSRMDKYQNDNNNILIGREQKNEDVYKKTDYSMYDDATIIDNSNEVDITKIKNILKSREDYKRAKSYRDMLNDKKYDEIPIIEEQESITDYDINSILIKAKEELTSYKVNNEIRELKNTEFDILKNLDLKQKNKQDKLVDLINTITHSENELDKDLLSDLVGDNTTVTPPISEENITVDAIKNVDGDFYSDSAMFNKKDFLDKKSKKIRKKNNFFVKFLIFILLIIVLTIGFFIINYFFKFM